MYCMWTHSHLTDSRDPLWVLTQNV
uniref:Uncharacterized protein n=1 Tax=Anguilla anguilla TaxID=7936 RepID=A0A0E9PSP4_ANGAN